MEDLSPGPVIAASNAPLRRLRVLQWLSIALIVVGLVLPIVALATNPGLLSGSILGVEDLLGAAALLFIGLLCFVAGLLMNAVRAVVVRRDLPPERYRGPAVGVLLLLALVVASIVSLVAVGVDHRPHIRSLDHK